MFMEVLWKETKTELEGNIHILVCPYVPEPHLLHFTNPSSHVGSTGLAISYSMRCCLSAAKFRIQVRRMSADGRGQSEG